MPIATIKILEGRTEEQKRALVAEVTGAIHRSIGSPVENITVIIEDMPKTNYAVAGILTSDKKDM